ncbi:hypothetical protein GCM10027451_16130 [Geodermatophilus aquaeductus]
MKVLESPTPAPATGRHASRLEALGRSARLSPDGETPDGPRPLFRDRYSGMLAWGSLPPPKSHPWRSLLVIPTVIPMTAYLAVSGCLLRSNRTPPNSRKRSSGQ